MRIDILTLFPEMCDTVLRESIIGRARTAFRPYAGKLGVSRILSIFPHRGKFSRKTECASLQNMKISRCSAAITRG